MVSSFSWSKVVGLTLDDWIYSTTFTVPEAKKLVGALNEHIARLGVVGSTDLGPNEFVD